MSKSNKKEIRIRVVGERRKEPDVRRLAKAIIRLSRDADEATDWFADLAAEEHVRARRRRAVEVQAPEEAAS